MNTRSEGPRRAEPREHGGSTDSSLRHSEVLHFALRNELLHGAGDVFDWHLWIDAVLVKEIDDIGPEPFQGCVGNFPDALRAPGIFRQLPEQNYS